MALPVKDDRQFKWSNLQVLIARAVTFSRSRAQAVGASGTTLQSVLAEAIVEIDSAQDDPLASLGGGALPVVDSNPELGTGIGKGKLQKVEDLLTLFFGDGVNPGLLDELKNADNPIPGA